MTIDIDKELPPFEAWARTCDGNCSDRNLIKFTVDSPFRDGSTYANKLVERDWLVWQARAAIPSATAQPDIRAIVKAAVDQIIIDGLEDGETDPVELAANEAYRTGKFAGVHAIERAFLKAAAPDPDASERTPSAWIAAHQRDATPGKYVFAPEQRSAESAAERDVRESRESWQCAMAQAAFYVEHHCANGEHHAEAIMGMPLPKIYAATAEQPRSASEDADAPTPNA